MVISASKRKLMIFSSLLFLLTSCGSTNHGNGGNNNMKDNRNLSAIDYAQYNLCGEDALGQTIARVDGIKKDKNRYLGIFYSMWLGQHKDSQKAVYDITELEKTEDGRVALASTSDNDKSKINEFHFWGEPLYGYYNTRDPFVLTRHIELFMNAGLDYLCIDNTNNVVYSDSTYQLLDLLLKYQQQGYNVPKVMFYTNSYSGTTVQVLYDRFYKTEKYLPVLFAPNGKPMIIGITKNNNKASDQTKYYPFSDYISDFYLEKFDVKESEWPNGDYNENSIPWMSWEYPQRVHNGAICVDVAQHSHSVIYVSSKDNECSRAYNNLTGSKEGDYKNGLSFEQMWNTALTNEEVNNVLVCSFNEWMAIKQPNGTFVDVYDEEYSRDIEMQKGGNNDNFYLQLVRNTRKYKYNDFVKYDKDKYTIDIENGVSPIWDVIKSHYQDLEGDAMDRDFDGAVEGLHYTQYSKRNDINLVKVTHDDNNIYFYISCATNITPYNGTDESYMNIMLKTNNSNKNFLGCNVLINRQINGNKGSVEISNGGYDFTKVDEADISINENVMQVKIPRANIETNADCDIEFKVTDNVSNYKDEMDYYVTGDVVPLGRLRYGY